MASLLPPETATIVFAHTPTGAVPSSYWWIDGRFALDARFALMPALRVVYVPVHSTFVAYDVGILTGLASGRSGRSGLTGLTDLSGLATMGTEKFLELTGRVAETSEREELVVRLRKVLTTRAAVERLLALKLSRDAIGLVRAMNPASFDSAHAASTSSITSSSSKTGSISAWIASATRVQDLINVAVIGIAFAIMFATHSNLSALGVLTKVVNCVSYSMYGPRDALGFVIATALKYGTVLLGSFYPRIASVITRNRSLGCAVSIALSTLSVANGLNGLSSVGLPGLTGLSGLPSVGLTGLPGLTGLNGLNVLGNYASTVSYATTETTIGCIGDIAETLRARQTGEIIASVVLVLANVAAGNDSAVVVSADAFERLVVARFGTCLVPKTMLSALVALAQARGSIETMFEQYLKNMRLMGSMTHRFARCLLLNNEPSTPSTPSTQGFGTRVGPWALGHSKTKTKTKTKTKSKTKTKTKRTKTKKNKN
jgi:hypothetical protein